MLPLVSHTKEKDTMNYLLEEKLKLLFLKPSPYVVVNGLRYKRETNVLVSESIKIICIDTKLSNNNSRTYSSLTECSVDLNINRSIIKNRLITGD